MAINWSIIYLTWSRTNTFIKWTHDLMDVLVSFQLMWQTQHRRGRVYFSLQVKLTGKVKTMWTWSNWPHHIRSEEQKGRDIFMLTSYACFFHFSVQRHGVCHSYLRTVPWASKEPININPMESFLLGRCQLRILVPLQLVRL